MKDFANMSGTRVSVSVDENGWSLVVVIDGETFVHPLDYAAAVELSASLFTAALCMPECKDPEEMTARFGVLVEQKGEGYRAFCMADAASKGKPS